MKKDMLKISTSSFMSLEKDFGWIINEMLKNQNLKKMLYYTTEDCLNQPMLNQEQTKSLINRNIKIVPLVQIDKDILNYVIIGFDNFSPNETNPQYRDHIITIDILCHHSQWNMGDFKLRPFKIAGEIDGMLNNKHLSGIGTVQFAGAQLLSMNNQIGGITLIYSTINGGDDKVIQKGSNV